MNSEKVMTEVKSILESSIDNLKKGVEGNQEFTYLRGRLDAYKWILNLINIQEELIDRLEKIKRR